MKKSIIVLLFTVLLFSVAWTETGLTIKGIQPENTDVIGRASQFIPTEKTSNDNVRPPVDNRDWELIDTIFIDSYVPAGGHFGVGVNGVDHTMEIVSDLGVLTTEAKQAIFKAPRWLKAELENVFSQLSEPDQLQWATVINDAQHPYIDEIAFCIAQSSVVYLASEFAYPDLFIYNAWLIYDHDLELDYVEVVDYGDPSSDPDYYSTTRYWKTDENDNLYQVEVPKDIYYMYLVHPKNTDEIPAYIDPAIIESNSTHQNNVVSPTEGVFWRDYLYDYNDPGYPKLKYYLQECDIVWNGQTSVGGTVIGALNTWVNQTMVFTSNAERPHQPVRIYKKHIGRCGEHADLRSAIARAALIPCTSILTMSTDHTWNEFWDEGWIHWDGAVNNPLLYENGWGKHHGSVFEIMSNGNLNSVSDVYSEGSAILNVYVLDSNNDPVDGARIILGMHNGSNIVADMVAFTGNDGKYSFIVGEDVSYYAQVQSYVGDIPGYMLLVEMAEDGMEYDLALYPGGTMPETVVTEITMPEDDYLDYKLVVNCEVPEQIPHGRITFDDIDNTEFYDHGGAGSINFFMADLIEYYLYTDNQPYQGFDPHYDVEAVSTEFAMPDPVMGYWYAFFDNKYRVGIPQHLIGSFELYAYDGAGGTGIISGTVTDEYTGEPLADVEVSAGIYATNTDGAGYYSLEVFPNSYEIICIVDGYFPEKIYDISVAESGQTTADVTLVEFPDAPANVVGEITPEGYAYITWDEAAFLEIMNYTDLNRELESYNVYVGEAGTELNVDQWSLSGAGITGTEYTDMIFPYLPMGIYRYAVKAVYSGGNLSPAICSNKLYNQMLVNVGVSVSTNSGDSVEGATITLSNLESTNSIFEYTTVIDAAGYTSFSDVLIGTYDVSIQLDDFDTYTEELVIEEDTELEILLIETIDAVFDLSVVNFVISWEHVPANREFLNYNVYLDDMVDPIATTENNSYTFDGVDNGYHIAAVTALFTTGESAYSEIGFEDGISINSNLLAYYPFNGDVLDESGNNHHGTIIGEISYPDGELSGAAAEFTGMDDYIEVATIFTEAPDAFSIVWWLNPTTFFNWSQQIRAAIGWNGFNFHTTAEGNFYVGTNTGTRFTPDQLFYRTILPEEWQQFCYSYSAGFSAFYINGEKIASKTGTTAPVAWNGLWIGCDNTNTIDGMIDEIRLWDRPVGSAEIQYMYTETIPYWGEIEGYVISEVNSDPVPDAVIKAGMFETTSDGTGYFLLDVAATTYMVTCQVEGYDMISLEDIVVDPDGTTEIEFLYPFTGSDDQEVIPENNVLLGNYPNPFNPSTVINFQLSEISSQENAELSIYNLKGQKIKRFPILNDQSSIVWDGTDNYGNAVSSGVYYYRLEAGSFSASRKMVLIK